MQIKAKDKLRQQEANEFICIADEPTLSTEIQINQMCGKIIEDYISQIIEVEGKIDKKDALYSATYLCKKQTGHGSVNGTRNHLDVLTSLEAPYEVRKDQKTKKKIIVKRIGQ